LSSIQIRDFLAPRLKNSALLSFQNSAIITDVGAKNKTQENR